MPDDDGLGNRKLLAMKIARWSKLKEKLEKETLDDEREGRPEEVRDHGLRARGVLHLQVPGLGAEGHADDGGAGAAASSRTWSTSPTTPKVHFLGMTTMRQESEYLVFHQVNICLMSHRVRGGAGADQGAAARPGLHRPLPRRGDGDDPGRAGREAGRAHARGADADREGAADLGAEHPDGEGVHPHDAAPGGDDVRVQERLRHRGARRPGQHPDDHPQVVAWGCTRRSSPSRRASTR